MPMPGLQAQWKMKKRWNRREAAARTGLLIDSANVVHAALITLPAQSNSSTMNVWCR